MTFVLSRPEAGQLADDVQAGKLDLDRALADARAAGDVDRVATLLFVAHRAGRRPTTAEVAPLLPDVALEAFTPLAALPDGDRLAMLLDAADADRMSHEREAVAAAMATLLLDGAPPPARLKALMRRLARNIASEPAALMLDVAVRGLGDEDVLAVFRQSGWAFLPVERERAKASLERSLRDPLAGLAAEPPPRVVASGFTARRTEPKVGRNDPCPCGSGKKYKKCCITREEAPPAAKLALGAEPPPAYALATDRLTPEAIHRLGLGEILALDLAALKAPVLAEVITRLIGFRRFEVVERVLPLLAERDAKTAHERRQDALYEAVRAGDRTTAERLLASLPEDDPERHLQELPLALLRHVPDELALLERQATEALLDESQGDGVGLIDLPYAVIDRLPALGILLARAAMRGDRLLDSAALLEEIERARDRLDLQPNDPAAAAFDEGLLVDEPLPADEAGLDPLDEAYEDVHRLESEVTSLRDRLAESKARMDEYARSLREQQEALARAQAAAPAAQPSQAAVEPEELRRLRQKVAALKGQIAEGNRERAQLRHELLEAQAASEQQPAEAARSAGAAADARDAADVGEADAGEADAPDDDAGAGVSTPRVPLIPDFSRARASLEALPQRIVRTVVTRVAAAAAGDEATWRQVKQMQDLEPPLLTLRIGIHYRALLRIEDGQLSVLEVVPREKFDTTLKRYRRLS